VGEGAKLSLLGAGITRITPPALPYDLPRIAVVVRFLVDDDDWGTTHQLALRWTRPDGGELVPTLRATFGAGTEQPPGGEEHAIVLVAEIGPLHFEHPGPHTLELYLDEDILARRGVIVQPA
jgi:hypothetical protein